MRNSTNCTELLRAHLLSIIFKISQAYREEAVLFYYYLKFFKIITEKDCSDTLSAALSDQKCDFWWGAEWEG